MLFASTDGLRLPRIQTYIAKITLLFCFFTALFQYESTMFSIKTSREIIRLLPLPILRNISSCCACVVCLLCIFILFIGNILYGSKFHKLLHFSLKSKTLIFTMWIKRYGLIHTPMFFTQSAMLIPVVHRYITSL